MGCGAPHVHERHHQPRQRFANGCVAYAVAGAYGKRAFNALVGGLNADIFEVGELTRGMGGTRTN